MRERTYGRVDKSDGFPPGGEANVADHSEKNSDHLNGGRCTVHEIEFAVNLDCFFNNESYFDREERESAPSSHSWVYFQRSV